MEMTSKATIITTLPIAHRLSRDSRSHARCLATLPTNLHDRSQPALAEGKVTGGMSSHHCILTGSFVAPNITVDQNRTRICTKAPPP